MAIVTGSSSGIGEAIALEVDIVVNKDGEGFIAPSEELTEEDWRRVIDVDLIAAFLCASAAARHMLERGSGVTVNIAFPLAHTALPGRAAYAAAKHGLIGLTTVLGAERAPRGCELWPLDPGKWRLSC